MATLKKFFTSDTCSSYFWGRVEDGRVDIDFLMKLFDLIERSRRGVPWKCLLALGTMAAAERDPTPFPFKPKYAYVDGGKIYLFSSISKRRIPTAVCWRHNFTKTLRQFDEITKAQFIELFGETGVEIRLRPPRRSPRSERAGAGAGAGGGSGGRGVGAGRERGRPQPSRRPTEREAGEIRFTGARRRAVDAGIIDRVNLNGERPTV